MTRLRMVPALLLLAGVGACDHSLLDVTPVDEISEDIAIVDQRSAEAALVGAYAAAASTSYYGGTFLMLSETMTDNVEHTGTFESYADANLLFLRPDMSGIAPIWEAIYRAINRVNLLIRDVPPLDMDEDARNAILGQAHALRALHYFNLVRSWGDVPLVLEPPESPDQAAEVARTPTSQVYSQIEDDLATAETMLGAAGIDNSERTFVTPGFVDALQAKVALYREDWAGAEAEAREVIASGDYDLADDFGSLFTASGAPTEEDIFRVMFTATEYNNLGYYYQYAGRFEIGATTDIYNAYDASDERFDHNFEGTRSDGIQVVKFPTTIGGEDLHVIRFGEVKLILAEALAEQNELAEAVDHLNDVRARSGVGAFVYVPGVTTQQQVLEAIYQERRLELAFEGDRWFDLVRTGRAAAALGSNFDAHEALWPIPVSEMDVARNLVQNAGY